MSAPGMLWFFLWRSVSWGAGLCALSGAAYPVLGTTIFLLTAKGPGDGTPIVAGLAYLFLVSLLFGVLGAASGSFLGLLCGLALFGLTRAFYYSRPFDAARFRRAAGWVCASATALLLLADWFINGYPNTEDFGLLRFIGNTNVPPELSALEILLFVVTPTLLLSLPMWISGRLVAGRYARRDSEANYVSQAPTGDGLAEEG